MTGRFFDVIFRVGRIGNGTRQEPVPVFISVREIFQKDQADHPRSSKTGGQAQSPRLLRHKAIPPPAIIPLQHYDVERGYPPSIMPAVAPAIFQLETSSIHLRSAERESLPLDPAQQSPPPTYRVNLLKGVSLCLTLLYIHHKPNQPFLPCVFTMHYNTVL